MRPLDSAESLEPILPQPLMESHLHITHVKYAGQRTGQDTVTWFSVPFEELLTSYFNTGDMCVYESTLRLMGERSGGYDLNIDHPVDLNIVAQLREQKSTILLRGSNYLHDEMEWGYLPDWLEALRLPVVACGIGAQAEVERPIRLRGSNERVWKLVSEFSSSIGVRGSFSAETLHVNGIHNIDVVGCPSMFRARDRHVQLRHREGGPERVSFSIRREVDDKYSVNPVEFQQTQKRILAKLDLLCDLHLSCHGEPEEKAFFFRVPSHVKRATAVLAAQGWFDAETGAILKRLYDERLYYVSDPSVGDLYSRQFDAAVGYRVHAILPALAVGTPGLLLTYDTRSKELAETFDLPSCTPGEFEAMTLEDAFRAERFTNFESKFPERYDRMKQFFERNGVSTRM